MSRRRFEFQSGTARKFWEIELQGLLLTTAWGRLGTAGQAKTKQFDSMKKAQSEFDRLVAEKLKKGYLESTFGNDEEVWEERPALGITAPPRINISAVIPELARLKKQTIRLNARSGQVKDLKASKFGGKVLVPESEPWPYCDEHTDVPLIPVLQLNKAETPNFDYYPGTDLFQVFFCPIGLLYSDVYFPDYPCHLTPMYAMKPFVFWRKSSQMQGASKRFRITGRDAVWPEEAVLNPEVVDEYPPVKDLPEDIIEKLEQTDILVEYEADLSVCPGNKAGGYPHWVNGDETPSCQHCNSSMEHLVTFACFEYLYNEEADDLGVGRRWEPTDDLGSGGNLDEGDWGILLVFVCKVCNIWPITAIYQKQ